MNLYRNLIAIFLCLFVKYGSKPVESAVTITHNSSSTTHSGGSDGSESVSAEGASTTPPDSTETSSVASQPQDTSGGAQTGQSGSASASPAPRARAGPTSAGGTASSPISISLDSDDEDEEDAKSQSQPSAGQGTGTAAPTSASPASAGQPTSGQGSTATSKPVSSVAQQASAGQPTSGQGSTATSKPAVQQPSSSPPKTSTDTSQTQSSQSQATPAPGAGTPAPTSGTSEPKSSTSKTGVDININSDTKPSDKFDYKKEGYYATYTPKGNNAFKLVKDDNTEVWKASGDTNYASKVEVEIIDDSKAVTVCLDGGKNKVFIKENANKSWTEIDLNKVNPESVNVDYSYESYSYKCELKGETRTFTAKSGFAFNCANKYVNNKKVELWKTDKENEYSNKIVNEGNKITIQFSNGSTKVITKGSDGKWSGDSQSGTAKPSTPKNGVDLNIKSDTKSGNKFDYNKEGEYVIYTAKDNNAFKLVKDHKTEVWKESNASHYSPRVEVEFLANEGKAVTIFLTGNKTKIFKKTGSNDPWKEIDTTKVTRSSINVDFPNQSYFYHNVLKGKFRTFTAKQGFAFNCANEYVNNNKVEIWKTDKDNENANKIEVDSLNNDGKAVTVHMPDNKTKLFIRNNKNDPWNEVDLSKVTPKSVNIRYEHDSHFYSNIFNNNVRTFTAKKGFAFNGANDYVNNDKVEIWKTDKENENANKIVYEGGNKLTIHIGEGTSASTKVFNKGTDGKWTEDTSASTKQAQSTPARGAGSTAPPSAGTGVPRTRTGGTAGGTAGGSASGTAMSISLDDDEDDDQSQSQPSSKQGTGTAAPPSGSPASAGQQATTEQGTVPKTAGQQPATTPPAPESGAPATPPQPGAATTPPTQPASTPPTQPESGQAATPPTQPESGQAATPPPQPGAGTATTPPTGGSGQPGATTGTTTESGGTAQPKVKLLKVNPADANNPLELASNEYSSSTSGNVVTYQIANGVNCTQLMLDDVLLWEYDKEQRGGEYPKSVDHDATNYVVVLKFEGLDIKFENTTEGWVFTESGPLAVKFHVVDPNDATKTVELASNNLTVTPSGDITTFTIADNVNCTKLLYGPILLWEHDTSQQGGKHPKSLVYTRSTETLVLKFEGIDVTFAKNDQGQWEFTETDTSAGGQAATPPTQPASTPPTQPESGQAATPPPQPGAGTATTPPTGGSDQSGEGTASTPESGQATKPESGTAISPESGGEGSPTTPPPQSGSGTAQPESVDITVSSLATASHRKPDELDRPICYDKGPKHLILELDIKVESPCYKSVKEDQISTYSTIDGYDFMLVTQGGSILYEAGGEEECAKKVQYWEGEKLVISDVDNKSREILLNLAVDVNNKQSTDHVTYDKVDWDGIHTFTAIPPSYISTVKRGDEVLWNRGVGDRYVTRIAVSDYDKDKLNIKLGYHPHDSHLQIQDIDDTIDHFADELTYRFSDSAKPVNVRYNKRLLWQNAENKNHKFLNLRKSRNEISVVAMDMSKFYVVTKGSPKVNDESKYNFRKIGNNEGHYFFKKGVQCTEVGVYNEPIWKHSVSEYKGAYPKAVSYYGNDEVVVSFSDFSLHFSSKALLWRVLTVSNPGTTVPKESKDTKKDEKVPVPSPQTAKPTTHHHIKLYQPDPNDSKYVVELDSSKYRFNKDKFVENVYNYYFNDDSKCTLIKLWDTNLWHYDYQVDDGQFPKSLIYDPSEYRLALQLDLTNIFYSMDENGKWTAIDPGLVLYTIDPKDDTNLVQLFTNQYGITEDPNNQFVFYYHFKEGVNCSLVKSEGADVWSQDFSNPNPKYPFKMKYEAKYRWLLLNFDGLFVNCQKNQDGKWNCKETNVEIPQEEQSTEPEFEDDKADEGLYKHKFVRETKDSSKPKTLEDTSESQTAVPPSEDSTQSQVSSQSQSEQAPESQQPARKSASETHSTSTVPKTSTGTGQAQPSSRSTQPKPADAKTGGEPSKQTASQSQSSTPAAKPSTPKNGVDLNIKSDSKSKDKFEYKKEGEYVIYTAKDNNAFKLVKDHKTEVWKESNASHYSPRVEVEFLANEGKAVTIFLTGNKTKIFKKTGSNDPWKEIDTTKVTRSSINVDFPNQSYFYHNVLKGKFRTFTAKQGFAFNCANEYVNNNKVEIWKTVIENENANKIEVDSLNNDGKAVTVHMPDNKTKLFIRNNKNDPWNEVDLSKVTPKSVNIRYEHDSHFYSNIFNNNVRTFTAKKGFAFNGANDYVNNDKVEIWKTDKENENANKIVYEGGNKLTIHIGEGTSASTKVFNKGTDGKWTEDTSASTKQAQSTPARGAGSTAPPSAGTGVPRTRTGGTAGGTAGGSASGTAMSISLDDDEDDDQSQSQPSSKQGTGTAAPPSGSPASAGQQATTEQGTVPKTAGQQPATTPPAPESGAPATPPQPGAATTPPTQPASTPPTQPESGQAATPPTQPESGQAATPPPQPGAGTATTPPTGGSGQPGATTGTTTESGGTAQPKVKLLKVNPADANNPLELASNEYSSSTSGNVVTYQIANGVNCTQLMLDDVLLWEYDKEQRGGEYPKSVDHDATNYVVVLKFEGLDIKFENTTEGWVFTESGPLAVKFHVVDPNDATKTVELASNNLTVTPSGDITTFTIADNVNCTKLLYGPILLWEHDTSQQGGKHPKSLVYTRSTETLVLKFEGIDVTFAKNDQGQWEFTETDTSAGGQAATPPTQPASTPPTQPESGQAATPPTQPESGQAATPPPQPGAGTATTPPAGGFDQSGEGAAQPKVKLLKVNPADANDPLELASNEYSSSTSGNVVTYQIANGVSCTQLMLDDVLLWEYDKEQRGGEYPKSVDHDATNYVVVLKFEGLDIKFENTTEGWVFTESGPLAVKFHVVDPNDATKTVELASNNLTVTPSGDITTFTIADNVNCTKLLYGPILLWEHNASQQGGKHPKSLVYTRSTETLVLKFEGIDVTFAKNDQGQWEFTETDTSAGGQAATPPTQPASTPPTQPESGQAATPPPQPGAGTATTPPTGGSGQPGATTGTTTESGGTAQPKVKLLKVNPADANDPLELASNEYSSSTSGNVVTYQIANGVSCTQLMLDDVLLWEYDKEQRGGEYPKSVDHDATNYVVVLKFEGLDIKFENTTEGWVFTESGPLAVKFHVVDPNDATKTVELASNNLTVTPSGDITTFTIADNVNCTKLLYGPILLWEHDTSQQGGKHPKSLVYTRSTETLVLKFEGIDVTFAKNNEGGWEFTETDTSAGGQAATPPTQPESGQAATPPTQPESGQAATPPPQPGAGTATTPPAGGFDQSGEGAAPTN